MSFSPQNQNNRSCQGFSLVEVAMALGIVSFVLVTMVGLLSSGLATFKQAMGNTYESQIVQSLTNDLLLDNFSVLNTYVPTGTVQPPVYYYDSEGNQLPSQAGWVYKATITLTPVDGTNSPITFINNNGSNSTPVIEAYSLVISITNVSDNTVYTQQHPHQYSIIIANNGL